MLNSSKLFKLSWRFINKTTVLFPAYLDRLPLTRTISLIPLKRPMNEKRYAKKDNVPSDFRLIYRAPLETYLKVTKILTTTTTAITSLLAGFKYATENKYFVVLDLGEYGGLMAQSSDLVWFAGGFILVNAAMLFCISKYPLRIYKNDKRYIAIYQNSLSVGVKTLNFSRGQVREWKHRLNPWSIITYRIRNKTSFLLLDYFKTPSEFHEMCAGEDVE